MFVFLNDAIFQVQTFLASIGLLCFAIVALQIAMKLCRAIRVFILPRVVPSDLTFYGKWAVITGGSSGIGKSYAKDLARRGMNVVIISNELETLKSAATEISSENRQIQCSYIHADFTEGTEVYERVMHELNGKDIGILLNGAGIVGNSPCLFAEESEGNALAMIDIHIGSVMNMTLKVLPLMLAKKKGVIVNISSMTSLFPQVLYSTYSSCKCFTDRFTRSLCSEYAKSDYENVRFQSLTPAIVATRNIMLPNIPSVYRRLATNCEKYARSAVATIGTTDHTIGYWVHELSWFWAKLISAIQISNISRLKSHRENKEFESRDCKNRL